MVTYDYVFDNTFTSDYGAYDFENAFDNCPVPTLSIEGKYDLIWKAEKAALQQVLDWFIMEEMSKTGTYFPYEGLKNNSVLSKEYRIMGLQPKMQAKQIYFPSDICQEEIEMLKNELKGFTKEGATTKNDDHGDCLANFLDPEFLSAPTPASGSEVQMDEEYMDEYQSPY